MPAKNTPTPPNHPPPPPPRPRPPPPPLPSRIPLPPPPAARPQTPQIRPPNTIHNSANGATGHRHRASFHGYPMAPFRGTNIPGRQAPTTSGTLDFVPRTSTLRPGIQRYQPASGPTPRRNTMQPPTHLGRLASGPAPRAEPGTLPRAESGTHLGRLAPSSIPRTGVNPRNHPPTSIPRTSTIQPSAPRYSSPLAPQRAQDRRRSDFRPRGTLAPSQTIQFGAAPRAQQQQQQQQQQPRSDAPASPLPSTGDRMSPESKQLTRACAGAANGLPKNKFVQRKNHKEVVAVNPPEIVKVTEVMPDGYWCGRFSGLSGRMAETNPGMDLKTLDRLVLDMLEKCCEGADVKKGFKAWRKEFEGRKRWEGKDN